MNKEIELLRTFRVAAESSSFREAAVRLSTSPQGVTRAIQQLELHDCGGPRAGLELVRSQLS